MFSGKDIADFFITIYDKFGLPFGRGKRHFVRPSFVLAGPSGVGKTHISASVANDLSKMLDVPERTYETRRLQVENEECQLVFFDTPGHKGGEHSRNEGLQRATQNGEYGVILVGSFGFHESQSMDAPPIRRGKVDSDWLKEKLESELEVFGNVLHRAEILRLPKVVVTLVNKADLWLDDWEEVKNFYENADYHKQLVDLGVQHVVLKYCVVPKKFWGLDKPALKLDLNEAQELHQNLVGLLSQYVSET